VRARRHAFLALVLLAAGCGGSDQPAAPPPARTPEPPLTREERDTVRRLEAQLTRHCVRVAQAFVDPQATVRPAQERAAFAAADRLVALAARSPRAPLGAGQDLRLFLSDTVENLQGSNCDPRLLARLQRGLSEIPVE
jgi:hypothetical protein